MGVFFGGSILLNVTCSGFDLPTFIDSAFKKLQSDVEVSADILIGIPSTKQSAWPFVANI